jgi:hypothetical protein
MRLVDKVIVLPVITSLNLDIDRVLEAALGANLQTAIVIGTDTEGRLYFASSVADGGEVLWWMEKAKHALMGISE